MSTTITVSANNLYANGRIFEFENGEILLVRDKVRYTGGVDDEWETLRSGDRLELIAWRYYKDKVSNPERLWWIIADVNNVFNPFDLSAHVGNDLLIPNYERLKLILL